MAGYKQRTWVGAPPQRREVPAPGQLGIANSLPYVRCAKCGTSDWLLIPSFAIRAISFRGLTARYCATCSSITVWHSKASSLADGEPPILFSLEVSRAG